MLRRYVDAYESGDVSNLAEVLREDARLVMPPYLEWYEGRVSIVTFAEAFMVPGSPGLVTCGGMPTKANMQPAVAWYLQQPTEPTFRALSVDVLRIEDGKIAEIISLSSPAVFSLRPFAHALRAASSSVATLASVVHRSGPAR
ncbi:MAG TPA: nuclear transport factor 2 family protein [Gaiellaceae bacterium]|nr:nuclear transport factor 2 family protein [Gaiellaceae bacterium]